MIFVIDIGNTNTVLGVFEEEQLKYEWRIKTDRYKTADEFAVLIKSLFDYKGVLFSDVTDIIISSVVPPIMASLEMMCKNYFQIKPMIIGKNMKTNLKMLYPNPQEIGADRIVNAVGAIEKYDGPIVIIDFGTATTYCYINENKEYVGGIISPGITISMEALYQKAAKLPKIDIQRPDRIIGQSTIEAMQSGVFYGYIAQVDGIVQRIKKEWKTEPTVIATGGLAPLLVKASETIDVVDQYLTLNGLYLIYKNNK
ncbi:type III pantothenate kinase [Ornithinibacillus sp. 4-3]|uniref:Type III pantothenate kinase n=1 Tax=Ornithinibacillus sp. 4-3 TaxID=3231488 RepID=A0AB39HNW7_9BACI